MGYSPQGCKEADTTEATWHTLLECFERLSKIYLPRPHPDLLSQTLSQGVRGKALVFCFLILLDMWYTSQWASLVAQMVKESTCNEQTWV